jgi:hypothetical protein
LVFLGGDSRVGLSPEFAAASHLAKLHHGATVVTWEGALQRVDNPTEPRQPSKIPPILLGQTKALSRNRLEAIRLGLFTRLRKSVTRSIYAAAFMRVFHLGRRSSTGLTKWLRKYGQNRSAPLKKRMGALATRARGPCQRIE